jgi:hypothetical protein
LFHNKEEALEMFADGFNTEGLFTLSKSKKSNELNRFCKLEGMNYEQLADEVRRFKGLLGRNRHVRSHSGNGSAQ